MNGALDVGEQFAPFELWDGPGSALDQGWKIDGSKVKFWATKRQAVAGARAIGWPVNSITKVSTRFQIGWALADGRFGILRKDWYERRLAERDGA